ncbi:hypothetical protein U5801_27960, partial [Lamprobacter modestohalophilus]|uniref:hypothetical protein n=1 Tax=Lamprobacter modestohalophilus TaxID=1064514 RepID=UPI002ADEFE29|nr:hypothetical protein [Lamprobacter modestohalophilus]
GLCGVAKGGFHAVGHLAAKCHWRTAMTRLAIICEGQTEEGFVNGCLAPYLAQYSVYATPRLLGKTARKDGGGNVSVDRVVSYIRLLH